MTSLNLSQKYESISLPHSQINSLIRAVVGVQLAERLLPTPEIRGWNPDIGNISNVFICQLLCRKDENKEKEAGNGPLKKIDSLIVV